MKFEISEQIQERDIPYALGILYVASIKIPEKCQAIDEEFERNLNEINDSYSTDQLSGEKVIKIIRDLFKTFGTDPTRYRPSSEAMIRRIRKDKSLYRVNPIVDVNNIISSRYRVPIGIYDSSQINGDRILLDIGTVGEEFVGLNGRVYNAVDKPVLKDEMGIFGSPIIDSERTKISPDTESITVVVFSHKDEPIGHRDAAIEDYIELIKLVDQSAMVIHKENI